MKQKVTRKQFNSKYCFVCGRDNDKGIKSRFYETENQELVAYFSPDFLHQSYPNTLHGGISAAILDETIGRAICIPYEDMVWGVTMDLHLKYRKPVPLDCELKVVGRITRETSRTFEGSGELILPNGDVAVTASGTYLKVPEEKLTDKAFLEEQWGLFIEGDDPEEIELKNS